MTAPAEPAPQAGRPEIEKVLDALGGSVMLELLDMTNADLLKARTDPNLFETLRIAHDLLLSLRDEGVLGIFLMMPKEKQMEFVRWMGMTDESEMRSDRVKTLVSALRLSPLASDGQYGVTKT